MRGEDGQPEGFFSSVRPEKRIPADHPLRVTANALMRRCANCRPASTAAMPAADGRRSRRLLRALLLQAFYTVRFYFRSRMTFPTVDAVPHVAQQLRTAARAFPLSQHRRARLGPARKPLGNGALGSNRRHHPELRKLSHLRQDAGALFSKIIRSQHHRTIRLGLLLEILT